MDSHQERQLNSNTIWSTSKWLCLCMGVVVSSLMDWGGRMVRRCCVNFQCRGALLIWIIVGQGPTALAVGAGVCCLDNFSLQYFFIFLSPSLGDGPI